MSSMSSPTRTHCVDVPAQGSVGELQLDAGRDLVDRHIVLEVGTDPPEMIVRVHVLHPPAPRRLEERMDQEQRKRPPGSRTRATELRAGSNGSTCSSARHSTTASKLASGAGSARPALS